MNITQNDIETNEEEEGETPTYQFSEPFASAPRADKDHCIATWIEHADQLIGAQQVEIVGEEPEPIEPAPVDVPLVSPAADDPTGSLAVNDQMGYGLPDGQGETELPSSQMGYGLPGSMGVDIQTSACQYYFRVMAGLFDKNGIPISIREIMPPTGAYTRLQPYRPLVNPNLDHSSKFISYNDGFIFACTGGSPYYLYLILTDKSLSPIGEPIKIRIIINESHPPRPTGAGESLFSNEPSLFLHDLFPAESDGRFIALVGTGHPSDSLYVVNFTPDGSHVKSMVALDQPPFNWITMRCQGAVFNDDPSKLMLCLSSSTSREPRYATIPILDNHTLNVDDVDGITWIFMSFPDLQEAPSDGSPTLTFSTQEILRRCDTFAEILISTTGYFKDESLSSSLYRVKISSEGVDEIENQHHSAYGNYQVTFTRKDYSSSNNALFWLTIQNRPFTQGLYAQSLIRAIWDCPSDSPFVPRYYEQDGYFGDIWKISKIRKILSDGFLHDPWGPGLYDLLKSSEIWHRLILDPELRTPSLVLIKELDRYAKRIESQSKFPEKLRKQINPSKQIRQLLIQLLDIIDIRGDKILLKQFSGLKKDIQWESPSHRAERLAKHLMKSLTDPTQRLEFFRELIKHRKLLALKGRRTTTRVDGDVD